MGLSAASKRYLLRKTHPAYAKEAQHKVGKVMHEFAEGTLHSGSRRGPKVTSKKQAIVIALSEARAASHH